MAFVVFAAAPVARAAPVFFDMDGPQGAAVSGVPSDSVSLAGITASISSNGLGFNLQTADNTFGVDGPLGNPQDVPGELDYRRGNETITISFNHAVDLLSIELEGFGIGGGITTGAFDQATITFSSGGLPIIITATQNPEIIATFAINRFIPLGQSFTIDYTGTQLFPAAISVEGFGFAGFTIEEALETVIPEPGTLAVLVLGLAMLPRRRVRS